MFDNLLKSMDISDKMIDGKESTSDPLYDFYSIILERIRKITWEEFERLTEETLKEIGFVDVQRLSRGSQQGKDIVATWISRFTYGREIRIRFQCKHKSKVNLLKKNVVGDAITDFLTQENDEILVIVTNGVLSNDFWDTLDKCCKKGVFAISSNRAARFFCSNRRVLERFIDLQDISFNEYSHYFDYKGWFESLISQKSGEEVIFTLYKYWTEPYTWFFYQSDSLKIERKWTTVGGDFCLSVQNNSKSVIDLSGLTLCLVGMDNLPEFGVVNTTPKGSHDISRIEIPLNDQLKNISIVKEENRFLSPNGNYFCLMDFIGQDPGIYHFKFIDTANVATRKIRESQVYSIAYIPDPRPPTYVDVYESWPNSFLIVQKLFELTPEERSIFFKGKDKLCILYRDAEGSLQLKSPTLVNADEEVVSEMAGIKITHQLGQYVSPMSDKITISRFQHLIYWSDWCEEILDATEPRAPLRRAMRLIGKKASTEVILDALMKAHERTPLSRTINVLLFMAFNSLGYDGFSKFHLNLAYLSAPYDPHIAAEHLKLFGKISKEDYLLHIPSELVQEFESEL